MVGRHALLLGSTGLIGGHVLARLLKSDAYRSVTLIGRRHPDVGHDKLTTVTCDLTSLSEYPKAFCVDDVFCCLGTTIRAAGSRSAFYQVDHDYCVSATDMARQAKAKRFLMVSALNAKPSSKVSYYARVKGEAERDVVAVGLPSVTLMQPSLLEGERDELRFGEEIGQAAMTLMKPFTAWSKADWLSIPADVVADAMVGAALLPPSQAVERIRYRGMVALSDKMRSGQ
tara:strand:+ start:190033 stop:190719 length:687 start_codon:yes stop_codon:yes gene_type:complete